MNEEPENGGERLLAPGDLVADLGDRMAALLEEIRTLIDGPGGAEASEALADLARRYLPTIRGTASQPQNCGAVGALVFGRKLIPPGDAADHCADALIALQLGRCYLDGLGLAAAEFLTLAGVVAAWDNARHVGSENRAGRERRSENGRLMQAFSQMSPEERAALLAQVEG